MKKYITLFAFQIYVNVIGLPVYLEIRKQHFKNTSLIRTSKTTIIDFKILKP